MPYTGFLYAGLMIAPDGSDQDARIQLPHGRPRNAADHDAPEERPGRPGRAAVDGKLDTIEAEWDRRVALGVVMAAAGYPESAQGRRDHGLPRAGDDYHVFHAGTARRQGRRHGRRPRAVRHRAGRQRRRADARLRVADQIEFDGMQMRRDIGHRAIGAAAIAVMAGRRRDRPPPPSRLFHSACRSASSPAWPQLRRPALPPRRWKRPEGGGGISRLIEEGNFFERGGVNFSHVMGSSLPPSATAAAGPNSPARLGGDGRVAGAASAQSLRARRRT
jgi:hypothetical protein